MKRGKKICNALRDVRRQIAAANDIPYETTDCHYEGECQGTCPKCESEVRYIERELTLRRAAGKAVSLVGLSLGISAAFAANAPQASDKNDIKDSIAVETSTPNDTTATEENMIFGLIIEQQPEFPGGEAALMAFIKKNLKYPASASENGIQGRVMLSFDVEEDGSITNVEVMRSPDERLSQEAIRIVKMMPRWKPGKQRGKPVRVKFVIPVNFRLNAAQQKSENVNPSAIKTEKADTATTEENMFFCAITEQQAEFPGGEAALMAFIKKNLKYPADAAHDSIEGRVVLTYMVELDGSITEIEVMRSPDERLTKEAIRVIKMMPKWKPERRLGKPIRTKYVLPVTFRLR